MMSVQKEKLMNTDSYNLRSILTREKSANNLMNKLSTARLHNQKIKTMLKVAELTKINNNSRNKDIDITEAYLKDPFKKKASVKNFGTPTRRATNK